MSCPCLLGWVHRQSCPNRTWVNQHLHWHEIYICDFHCVVKHINGLLKICTLLWVYSHILANEAKDGRHFSYKSKFPPTKKDTHTCWVGFFF
jgi:hypothetical protein